MSNIARAFHILEMMVGEPEGVRVTDVANAFGLNRAIPHRLLTELVELGYVTQDPATERYRATFMLGSLGIRQLEAAGIPSWAQDQLTELAEKSHELVRLAVVTSDNILQFIAQAQGAQSALVIDSPMRSEIVLHATASGKAWLSSLPDDEVAAILEARGIEAYTAETKTGLEEILEEIRRAREDGFATTCNEFEAGVSAVAAPVRPPAIAERRAVGTVSIAGPSVRLTPDRLSGFGPAVRATADQLAAQWHVYEYLDVLTAPDAAG